MPEGGINMLKPLHDNVILEKEKVENKTASGIILSDKPKEQPSVAKVIAVGEGEVIDGKVIPMHVSVGDKVIFKRYGGTEVTIDDQDYLIVSQKDILAIVE